MKKCLIAALLVAVVSLPAQAQDANDDYPLLEDAISRFCHSYVYERWRKGYARTEAGYWANWFGCVDEQRELTLKVYKEHKDRK